MGKKGKKGVLLTAIPAEWQNDCSDSDADSDAPAAPDFASPEIVEDRSETHEVRKSRTQ